MSCPAPQEAWGQQTPVPGSARPCIRQCRKRAVEVPAPPPPVLASRSIPATTGCRTLTGPLVLLCHNPPQESGSTSPFDYFFPRQANHLQFTTPITRIEGPHYQKGGCGLEQRRLTPASILHLPKEKAMTLPPSLICADFEKKCLVRTRANS